MATSTSHLPSAVRRCPAGVGKEAWPELVGKNTALAKQIIERENPNVRAIVVIEGRHLVTQDFRCDRVWVWSSAAGVVVSTPIIG